MSKCDGVASESTSYPLRRLITPDSTPPIRTQIVTPPSFARDLWENGMVSADSTVALGSINPILTKSEVSAPTMLAVTYGVDGQSYLHDSELRVTH